MFSQPLQCSYQLVTTCVLLNQRNTCDQVMFSTSSFAVSKWGCPTPRCYWSKHYRFAGVVNIDFESGLVWYEGWTSSRHALHLMSLSHPWLTPSSVAFSISFEPSHMIWSRWFRQHDEMRHFHNDDNANDVLNITFIFLIFVCIQKRPSVRNSNSF